jgi:hypothetical protein
MSGVTPPLPQNAFMAWCSVKAQGQLYLLPSFICRTSEGGKELIADLLVYYPSNFVQRMREMTKISFKICGLRAEN